MKINGSLVFDASGISQIENLRVEKITGAIPSWGTNDIGRLIYVTSTQVLYVGGSAAWIAIATGGNVGNAAALQSEVDNIEITIGGAINADGSFNASSITLPAGVDAATSFTDALNKISAFASGKDALAELDDVKLTATAEKDLLQFVGGEWVNSAIGSVSGVQAYNAGLDALAQFNTNGIVVQTAENTFVGRTLVAPAEGVTIKNADGVAGSPTFALANDLAAVEGLATNGFAVRTGDDTWATRNLTGSAGRLTITNADGVAGSPTFDLAQVTQVGGGTFQKHTVDSYGRVIETTPVVTSDITSLVDAVYVNVAGDTMTGNLTLNGGTVTGLPTPNNVSDAANKAYVDAIAAGLSWKDSVKVASVANIDNIDLAAPVSEIDGVFLVEGDRVLVKDQTDAGQNGIYVLIGESLVRAADMDEVGEFSSATVFVQRGTFADTGWTQVNNVATIDTDPVAFSQFSGSAVYTFSTGLTILGNTVSVALGAGIGQLPTNEVGIDLFSNSSSALILTTDGTTRSTDAGATLGLLLKTAGGLTQDVNGLSIPTGGVSNDMLATGGAVTLDADAGAGVVNLGGTLSVVGNTVNGVSTSVADGEITVTVGFATDTQLGVAKFNSDAFSVVDGEVSLTASLSDLSDVKLDPDTATVGDILVFNGSQYVNKKAYFLYDSVVEASTAASYTVNHNLGQKYCNVTVVDSTDEVVIPQSIRFVSENQLVVTFNTVIDTKIVVMGIVG